jgi:dienelactone hydrolase
MTTVILFHHAHGLTYGVRAFADEIRRAGHIVHAPDLFDGLTFAKVEDGVAHAEEVGLDEIVRRGTRAATELSSDAVYAGFSLGVMPAQSLAQTRPGARGAILYESAVPTSAFGVPWPAGVPLQIHAREHDEWADVDVAKALVDEIEGAELFLYPGSTHLFVDPGLDGYDAEAAGLVLERTLAFLERVG